MQCCHLEVLVREREWRVGVVLERVAVLREVRDGRHVSDDEEEEEHEHG